MTYADLLDTEMRHAFNKFGPYHNGHEVYGVLYEELAEFFDHVRDNTANEPEAAYELVQLAAVALRYAIETSNVGEVGKVQDQRWSRKN
jgi:hypothetical protein